MNVRNGAIGHMAISAAGNLAHQADFAIACGHANCSKRSDLSPPVMASASSTLTPMMPRKSVLVIGCGEQNEFDTFRAIDIGIMARRNFEEIACCDRGFPVSFDHADDQRTTDAISCMMCGARIG